MGGARALILDYALLDGLAVLLVVIGTNIIASPGKDPQARTRTLIAAAVGLALLLALFGTDAFDAVTGGNAGRYPDQPTAVIVLGFLATLLVALATYDSVSTRIAQAARRSGSPSLRVWSAPALIVVGCGGLIAMLWLLEPNPPTSPAAAPVTTTLGTTTTLPGGPGMMTLVPRASRPRAGFEAPPFLTLTAITDPGDLEFPTFLTSPPNADRLFVLERMGRIRVIDSDGLRPDPLLDIVDSVNPGTDGGLIGLAFHPQFARNGRMFVHYTDLESNNRVVEYSVEPATATLRDEPPIEILEIEKPQDGFHAGGMMQFGPDNLLYIAIGDPNPSAAQDPGSQRGILRIDVDGRPPYSVPADNEFDDHAASETFAYGLRNPWRFWIDPPTNSMFIGDAGEDSWEEIDILDLSTAGVNFGWDVTEGSTCRLQREEFVAACDRVGLTGPILEYMNAKITPSYKERGGCAVIFGAIYRGSAMPDFEGSAFYSDFCSSWIGTFRYSEGRLSNSVLWDPAGDTTLGTPISFGVDADGELYLLTSAGGVVYRIGQGQA